MAGGLFGGPERLQLDFPLPLHSELRLIVAPTNDPAAVLMAPLVGSTNRL